MGERVRGRLLLLLALKSLHRQHPAGGRESGEPSRKDLKNTHKKQIQEQRKIKACLGGWEVYVGGSVKSLCVLACVCV